MTEPLNQERIRARAGTADTSGRAPDIADSCQARDDRDMSRLRSECELKDLLIQELRAALDGQARTLQGLARRVEELEQRVVAGSKT
jgi:hypothetical protein